MVVPYHSKTWTAVVVHVYPFQNEQNRKNSFWTVLIRSKGQLFP